MKRFFLGFFLKWIKSQLLNDSFRANLINNINTKIDIPNLTEEQEEKIFLAVYDTVIALIDPH